MKNRNFIQKSRILRDTPTGKPAAWSNTILDFLMKIKNLYFFVFVIYGFRDEICFSRSEPTLSQAKYHDALRFELICSINLAYLPLKSSAYGYWRNVRWTFRGCVLMCYAHQHPGAPAPDTHSVSKRCSKYAKGHILPRKAHFTLESYT